MLLGAIVVTIALVLAAMSILGTLLDIDWMEGVGFIGLIGIGIGALFFGVGYLWVEALT